MRMKVALLTAVSATLLASTAVAAPGFYAFGGLGYAHADTDDFTLADAEVLGAAEQSTQKKDDNDLALKLAGGYRFNDNFAIEGSYSFLGRVESNFKGSFDNGESAQAEASMKAHVLAIDALAIYPVNNDFEVFAKGGFGIASVKTQTYFASTSGEGDESVSESKTRFVPKIGFGAEWNVTKNVAIRAEYERLFGVSKGSDDSADADYDLVTVGVKYAF